jgi:ABC-type phosphate transport system substrate-binding protein
MQNRTFTWPSLFLVLAVTLTACGSASPAATTVPGTDVPASSEDVTQAPMEEELSGTIALSGAFVLYPMMTVWANEFTKLHPNVHLR